MKYADTGRKIVQGSTAYFIVVLVIFEDDDEAQKVDQRISLLKHELGKSAQFEFHFNHLKRGERLKFLEAVAPYDFFYFGIVINKNPEVLYGEGFSHRESFYKYGTKLAFTSAKTYLSNAKVVIDGSGDKQFKRSLQAYLKKQINASGITHIRKVVIQDSHSNNLLQLADMIAGALQRSKRQDKADFKAYRDKIRLREFRVQEWPRK